MADVGYSKRVLPCDDLARGLNADLIASRSYCIRPRAASTSCRCQNGMIQINAAARLPPTMAHGI